MEFGGFQVTQWCEPDFYHDTSIIVPCEVKKGSKVFHKMNINRRKHTETVRIFLSSHFGCFASVLKMEWQPLLVIFENFSYCHFGAFPIMSHNRFFQTTSHLFIVKLLVIRFISKPATSDFFSHTFIWQAFHQKVWYISGRRNMTRILFWKYDEGLENCLVGWHIKGTVQNAFFP